MRLKQIGARIIVLGIVIGVLCRIFARWNPRFNSYGPLAMFVLFALGALIGGTGMIAPLPASPASDIVNIVGIISVIGLIGPILLRRVLT